MGKIEYTVYKTLAYSYSLEEIKNIMKDKDPIILECIRLERFLSEENHAVHDADNVLLRTMNNEMMWFTQSLLIYHLSKIRLNQKLIELNKRLELISEKKKSNLGRFIYYKDTSRVNIILDKIYKETEALNSTISSISAEISLYDKKISSYDYDNAIRNENTFVGIQKNTFFTLGNVVIISINDNISSSKFILKALIAKNLKEYANELDLKKVLSITSQFFT